MSQAESTATRGMRVPFWSFPFTVISVPWITGNAIYYAQHGSMNLVYCVLSLFLSINLLVTYWEICIFVKADLVEERSKYWIDRGSQGNRSPAIEFLRTSVPLAQILSPVVVAEAFAAYAYYDRSYSDRRTFGYVADISNGFVTPIPSLLLFATYTVPFIPPFAAGVLGLMLYWYWVYSSSVYWWSFFFGGGHRKIGRREMYIFVWSTNAVWIVFPLVGLIASLKILIDGTYGAIGL